MLMNPECWWKCAGSVPNSPRPANLMLHEEYLSELDSNQIGPRPTTRPLSAFDTPPSGYSRDRQTTSQQTGR